MTRPGHIYKRFVLANGEKVALRVVRPEDVDNLLAFFIGLVDEKSGDRESQLHAGFDKKFNRRQEAQYIREVLDRVEKDEAVNIIADIGGKIVASGGVARGKYSDTDRHGSLGLTVSRNYRGFGIGGRIIQTLVTESRRLGLKSIDVEFLASNKSAERAYQRAGLKRAGIIPGKIFRNGKYFDAMIMARRFSR
jgi:RimJ/RimL family protein N-acetyltransferase